MTPDDNDKTPEEKPKPRRRRKPAAVDAPAPEATGSADPAANVEVDSSRVASDADATPAAPEAEQTEPEATSDEPAEPVAEESSEREAEASDDDDSSTPDEDDEQEPAAEADDEEPEAAPAKPARRRRRGAAAAEEEEAPAPAPARRRERPAGPPPVVRAQAKYVRSSPRKARLVCDHIRGKTVEEARAILAHTPRSVAKDWSKLLESAVANAEHNHELVGEDLYVKAVHADDGPTIKRFRPRAMGRATKIRKRTSHLTILLTPKG
jgi:ribosomal protein L22